MSHLAQLSQDAVAHGLGASLIVLLVAVALFHVVFFLAALVSILGADVGCGGKLLWLIVIFCLPFFGSLLWFVVGRPRRGY